MTNREWLNSLSDEEFVLTINYQKNKIDDECKNADCKTCKVHYCGSEQLLEWLQAEHKEA